MDTYHALTHRIAQLLGHDFGHALPATFHAVVDVVLLWGPLALTAVIGVRLGARLGWRVRRMARPSVLAPVHDPPLPPSALRFVVRHSWRSQLGLTALGLAAMPVLYAALELPKVIINSAIDSHHYPIERMGWEFSQVEYLLALCGLFLLAILAAGAIKYAVNVAKGRVGERLLRRLRLSIYKTWRRGAGPARRNEIVPLIGQEVEPVGGFGADVFALPTLQGGTFLTILVFMFVQDPILGAAAVTLLPVQLALIPRLQRRVNALARRRVAEMRSLGGLLGDEAAKGGASLRPAAASLRRVESVRRDIHRAKYFIKSLNNFLTALTPFFFYAIGGYLVIEDRLSLGALVAVLAAHKDMSAPLRELFRFYQTSEDVRVRFAALGAFLVLDRVPDTPATVSSPVIQFPRAAALARRM